MRQETPSTVTTVRAVSYAPNASLTGAARSGRRSLVRGAVALSAAFALGCVAGAAHAATTLRFATFLPPTSNLVQNVFKPWAEAIEKETQGALHVEFFLGGALGKNPAQQLKLMQDGISDITFFVPSTAPGDFPDNDVIQLPLLARDVMEASLASERLFEKGLLRGYEDIKMLALFTTPTYNLHLTYDYQGLESLKGKRLRTSTPVQQMIAERLGATPVGTIAVTETAEALSRGLVDGTILGWDSMRLFRVTGAVKEHVMVPLGFTPMLLAMNKRKFESLSPELRAAIDRHSGEVLAKQIGASSAKFADAVIQQARSDGKTKFIDPSEQELAQWNEALKPVRDTWISKNPRGKQLYDALLEELKQIRAGK